MAKAGIPRKMKTRRKGKFSKTGSGYKRQRKNSKQGL